MSEGDSGGPLGPRHRLANAVRATIEATVSAELDDRVVVEVAEALEALNRRLDDASGPDKRPRGQPDTASEAQEFFPTSPVIGLANPLAPPVRIRVVDGVDGGYRSIEGWANFGYPYEGPPTCVHGGVIAETFDEVLGAANLVADNPGMTGTLTVRYRKPTPLRTDLRIEARCVRTEGRKIFSWAGLYHGETLTAEAEGVFIEVAPAQFLAIAEGNVDSADPVMLAAIRAEALRTGAASDVHPGSE
jgi:Thioesterase superfamily